jgi:hypothetical protein
MNSQQLIDKLGYSDSPAFLQGERLREHHGYSFFFAQAEKAEEKEHCNLKGVYTLLYPPDKLSSSSLTPVVYVCEADNEAKAAKIHRRVWNQNIVPFLIVVTPRNIRLYSGFEYNHKQSDKERVLEVAINAKEVLSKLSALKSESIDSGDIWKQRPISVEGRVDRHLLADLKKLSEVLAGPEYKLPVEHAHTLIGKYIYLKYLKDRDILSDERFKKAEINADDIFGRGANKNKLYQLETYLDNFLNGSVFPLPSGNEIQTKHVQKVADVFKGDDPKSGQQVLFDIYDFSYVPIETLSVVYQQFLHQKGEGHGKGAYYTPVHLVNFILDELEAKKPIKEGMKIFDASCGSGAFLVQCYRRLVEGIVRIEGRPKPTRLRSLLTNHIFGLDADEKACRVAELSLSLTLLDYIDPPDLRTYPTFQLPDLHNQNIFHCDGGFFDDESSWAKSIPKEGYDWIVGNPPWKDEYDQNRPYDKNALNWINNNKNRYPIGQRQLAEAFAWKITEVLSESGQCGLFMPALTLFKKYSRAFRAKFFSQVKTRLVVNFANLRHCLFEKAKNPAAAVFFSGEKTWNKVEHYITAYAPFVVEQSGRVNDKDKSEKIWEVFVNYSSINEIPQQDIDNGASVPWKIAMWGTHRDALLLRHLASRKLPKLEETREQAGLSLSEGLQLRIAKGKGGNKEKLDLCNEVRGKDILVMKEVENLGSIHSFPRIALKKLPENEDFYTRKGRKRLPLSVCYPPHVIIDESRRFAVYCDDFIVVPPRQVGISGNNKQETFLKALAIYLKSNIAYYLQLWAAVMIGVERDVFNLDTLKKLPIPLPVLSDRELTEWAELHDKIVETERLERESQDNEGILFSNSQKKFSLQSLDSLIRDLNDRVYDSLGITKKQRWLIEDMLNVRLKLNDGKIDREAIDAANKKEIADFARIFQDELDLFLDHSGKRKVHKVNVLYGDNSVVMIVDHLRRSTITKPEVTEVKDGEIRQKVEDVGTRLREERSQWIYFTRCLRMYEGRRTYIFKPRQRLYWLKSQALAEADEFIAEKLATEQ